jgi:hypothetical protein
MHLQAVVLIAKETGKFFCITATAWKLLNSISQ